MNAADDVIDDGAVYIDGGRIVAVQPAGQAPPDDFGRAPRRSSGGTIYPGLIELHNHLAYNVLCPWHVPRLFTNRGQWPNHSDYRRLVSGPMRVLGEADGYLQAVVRYVEAKALMGGVTTTQGIRLLSFNQISAYYRGIVRNVEQTDDPELPEASTRVADVEDAVDFQERLQAVLDRGQTYLLHLAEGIDDVANAHFRRLKLSGQKWAINDALVGIHSTGLEGTDFETMSSRGGRIVWSPLSNLLLYGGTTDVRRARDAGVRIGLGSDWSPTGSKNLLGELKAAHLVSEHELGGALSPRDLVAMATRDAAAVVNWDGQVGSIEPGKRADLMVVDSRSGDPYMTLIEARETDVVLVVIDGVRRYGTYRLMRSIKGLERWEVGGSWRRLNLQQESADPVVGELTLREAVDRLVQGLSDLPELAAALETPASALNGTLATVDGMTDRWRLALDHDGDETALRPLSAFGGTSPFAGASVPLSQLVTPLELDPLTVSDDRSYLPLLARQPNLPAWMKDELPRLYGEEPVPVEARTSLRPRGEPVADALTTDIALAQALSLDDRRLIVGQARRLLQGAYVHLDLKASMHATDPVQRLRLLEYRLQPGRDDPIARADDDRAFHSEMIDIFTSLRDLHTAYLLPAPYRDRVVFLPFLVEQFHVGGERRYMVSRTAGDLVGHPTFKPGVEITHWNGAPIERAIEDDASHQAGSNAAARFARGLDALTTRPLVRTLPPLADWVTVTYLGPAGEQLEVRQDWLVWSPGEAARPVADDAATAAAANQGYDIQTLAVNHMKKMLYAPVEALAPDRAAATATDLDSRLPDVMRADVIGDGRYGHVRIFTFQVDDPGAFVAEFVRLVTQLPSRGLVIDVRGNGGGHIYAAEGLLQVLTPEPIRPEPTQFTTTELVADLCRRNRPSPAIPGLDLGPWLESVEQAVATGAEYSRGHAITPADFANGVGQRYYGPVVLVVDALCYSATDIFAAGFQDHGIGPVIGTAANTGAGGANVWTHGLLRLLAGEDDPTNPFEPLPGGASFNVAVRRTLRVNRHDGQIVEDLGVVPDIIHHLTADDLLNDNVDLIATAIAELERLAGERGEVHLDATLHRGRLTITTAGLDEVQVSAGSRSVHSGPATDGTAAVVALDARATPPLLVAGLRDGEILARRLVIA
jgi:hypothetical protein